MTYFKLLDSMPPRRRRSLRVLAAQVLDSVPPCVPISSKFGSFCDGYPIPMSLQSSFMLSIHFFLGLPLARWPLPYLCSSRPIFRNLSLLIRVTWLKYVIFRLCKRSTMSTLIARSCFMSTLRRQFRLQFDMPQILLRTDISNTLSLWPYDYFVNHTFSKDFHKFDFFSFAHFLKYNLRTFAS